MTTATGTRRIPFTRQHVWRALTTPTSYCPVCDVSYVFPEAEHEEAVSLGLGVRFICVWGRLQGAPPPPNAMTGEVVDWAARRRIGTRLESTAETWQTLFELADSGQGATDVTVTVTHAPKGGTRLGHALQRRTMQRIAQQTVDSELTKLPEHVLLLSENRGGSSAVEEHADGSVLHLRGEVDRSVVELLKREGHLDGSAVVAVDVAELTYIDATAFPVLFRWAQRVSDDGRKAVVRGDSPYFDQMMDTMGQAALFRRER